MYKYELYNQYEKYFPIIKPIFIPLNSTGFADILSIDLENTIKLRRAKNKINEIHSFLWEDIKKYTNPYELIYLFNNKLYKNIGIDNQNIKSIANIKPLSRSFFKMIEMITDFIPNIYSGENIINSLHIAEGPGGFIEATRYIRNNIGGNNVSSNNISNDRAFGITLIDNSRKNVPAWKQSNYFLKQHPEVIISTGVDGTGNIYNIDNILSLEQLINKNIINNDKNNKTNNNNDANDANNADNADNDIEKIRLSRMMDLITADGGFDYSIDYNYQEQASSKLIFCEIISAIKFQRIGGDFVCKIFDINAYITVEMLYILYLAYDKITIYKPLTSRIANSEKYIICNNFIGINEIFLEKLFGILNDWNKYSDNSAIGQLFLEIPMTFIEKIKEINRNIINMQILSINNIVNIINNKTNMNKQWKMNNLQKQIKNAKEWCIKYNIPYNEFQ